MPTLSGNEIGPEQVNPGAGSAGRTKEDNWRHRLQGMRCSTCMWFVPKMPTIDSHADRKLVRFIGRCRRHAPTTSGWPVMFATDFCGDHKIDEEKV